MAIDTISSAVHRAYLTALLLAGTTKTAEAAVLDGIGACEDLSHRSLLVESVRSAIRRRMKSMDTPDALTLLPPELRRLFLLQPLLQDCFVLRILVGLPREVCAGLLDVSIAEFDDAVYAALNQVPLLQSREKAHEGKLSLSEGVA